MAKFTSEIDIDLDEYLEELDKDEKLELYQMLCEDLNIEENVDDCGGKNKRELFVEYYRGLSPFEQRKFLVDALYIPSYNDDTMLLDGLSPILRAR